MTHRGAGFHAASRECSSAERFCLVPECDTSQRVNRRHERTLAAIFAHPVSGNIPWRDIEGLFRALGAEVEERAGSRVAGVFHGQVQVFHRPHPEPTTDKGAVASIAKWLAANGVEP